MEDYEKMLNSAFEKVKSCEFCDRFEIKKAEWHVQGKKTILNNFMNISNCLRKNDADNFAKFLSRELAELTEREGDRLIFNKVINSPSIIDEKIRKYADTFIVCSNCKKPDTNIIEENGKKFLRCMACGFKKQIQEKI